MLGQRFILRTSILVTIVSKVDLEEVRGLLSEVEEAIDRELDLAAVLEEEGGVSIVVAVATSSRVTASIVGSADAWRPRGL